jgi:hypothetical protein
LDIRTVGRALLLLPVALVMRLLGYVQKLSGDLAPIVLAVTACGLIVVAVLVATP